MFLSFTNLFHSWGEQHFPSTFNDLAEAQHPGPGRDPVSGRWTGYGSHFLADHAHP
jgi:hypothetical protein